MLGGVGWGGGMPAACVGNWEATFNTFEKKEWI